MDQDKPTVFLSYNWGSDTIADEVEKRLSPIATVLRDKSSIKPWGSIGEFMKQIRKTDLVVVALSDTYLKSVACMFEITHLIKDEEWPSYSLFLVEDSAQGIYKSLGQLEYIKYWQEKLEELEKELSGLNPALVTSQAEDLKKIKIIQLQLNDFMRKVADCNNPDLNRALDIAERRVKETTHKETDKKENNETSQDDAIKEYRKEYEKLRYDAARRLSYYASAYANVVEIEKANQWHDEAGTTFRDLASCFNAFSSKTQPIGSETPDPDELYEVSRCLFGLSNGMYACNEEDVFNLLEANDKNVAKIKKILHIR